MGRAIIRHPRAFLMDEPLSNLDAKLRVEMRAEIARLQRELAVTTVYVTHDQIEAMTMGTRVAVLRRRPAPAGRHAPAPLRRARQPVRRHVHRLAGHEPVRRPRSTRTPTADGSPASARAAQRLALDRRGRRRPPRRCARTWAAPSCVGIRPEALGDVALEPGAPADRVIEATVDLVESLGAELIVHVATDRRPRRPSGEPDEPSEAWARCVARRGRAVARLAPARRPAAGDVVKLAVDPRPVHLFDADTGASLRAPADA